MKDLADLFPGFDSHWIDIDEGQIFARSGGSGRPVVLVHGFPQTHVEWHKVAPILAENYKVVVLDLRGYGWSAAPYSKGGEKYSKRTMAGDIVFAMAQLGYSQFALVGHDRGAHVGYRLALDYPECLSKLALIDIVPTRTVWREMDANTAMQAYHWLFLAQPHPLPETMLARASRAFLDHTLASWTKCKTLGPFDGRAMKHYRSFFDEPQRIHACCEDYRAGATIDRALDDADQKQGRKIDVETLALWGKAGVPESYKNPLDAWREWASDVRGEALDCGHFLPEEAPDKTAAALQAFLA